MHSCLYEGYVRHRRLSPAAHVFRYRLYLVYLDLDEMRTLLEGKYGLGRGAFSPASFRRTDHLGDPQMPLADAVRQLVEERTGWRPAGPIRLLKPLRNWGQYFSPLSLYYCFDSAGEKVEGVVAEVTNTPWRERHWYVLWQGNRVGEPPELRFRHPKAFHVSPFMAMEQSYDWRFTDPAAALTVHMENFEAGRKLFDATMVMRRRPITGPQLARVLVGYPLMTVKVVAAIYCQALRLWWKRTPFHPHPKHRAGAETGAA